MDNRRFDTAQLMGMGILNIPKPETEVPDDREREDAVSDSCSFIGTEAVIAAVEAGKVVSASNYYGIPYVWKASEGIYRGTLLQYRAVTEDPTFATVDEAAEWFKDRYYSTDG